MHTRMESMVKGLLVFLLVVAGAVGGCGPQWGPLEFRWLREARIMREGTESWVGHSEDDLLQHAGGSAVAAPMRNGRKVLTYRYEGSSVVSSYSSYGSGGHVTVSGGSYFCLYHFTLNRTGIIVGVTWQGDCTGDEFYRQDYVDALRARQAADAR